MPSEIVKVERRLFPRGEPVTVTRRDGRAFQCELDDRFLHELGGETKGYFRVELREKEPPVFIRRVPNPGW